MDNSLAIRFPEIAAEWSERNLPVRPDMVAAGTHKNYWWKGLCGHEWEASPHNRTGRRKNGCPYCSGNKILVGFNDLESCFPEIAAEWSPKNAPLIPSQVTSHSNKKVWWEGQCGHEWFALISSRTGGHGCP